MNVEQARFNMIEQQIRPWDVLDPAVLSLLSSVHREDFVPEAHRAQALMDLEIPLDNGRALLAPRVEARLVQDLSLAKEETALLIGAATGYIAGPMYAALGPRWMYPLAGVGVVLFGVLALAQRERRTATVEIS